MSGLLPVAVSLPQRWGIAGTGPGIELPGTQRDSGSRDLKAHVQIRIPLALPTPKDYPL